MIYPADDDHAHRLARAERRGRAARPRVTPQPLGFTSTSAQRSVIDSVTKMFYDRGWRGINVEPGAIFTRLAAARPRDTNIQTALSDRSGSRPFYEFPDAAGLSTLSADARAIQTGRCVQRTIPVTTLADVCHQHASDRTIDFLKIDVEGHEREVLAGGDWTRFRPRILVIESQTIGGHDPLGRWEPRLDNDYRSQLTVSIATTCAAKMSAG